MKIDPPEFIVEESGEYVISVAWQGKPSDLWVDGYVLINGEIKDSFHSFAQKYNDENDMQLAYLDSRNTFTYLEVGDSIRIHCPQTGSLINTRLEVQKRATLSIHPNPRYMYFLGITVIKKAVHPF